jgi:hypothetical protein
MQEVVWVVPGGERKSSWWVMQVLSEFDHRFRPDMGKVQMLPDENGHPPVNPFTFKQATQYAVVDDAAYSGNQLWSALERLAFISTIPNPKIFIILPFYTQMARDFVEYKAKQLKLELVFCSPLATLQSMGECMNNESMASRTSTYFDHKFPDVWSTDQRLSRFVHCDDEAPPEKCFYPPYKESGVRLAQLGAIEPCSKISDDPYYVFDGINPLHAARIVPQTTKMSHILSTSQPSYANKIARDAVFVVAAGYHKAAIEAFLKTHRDLSYVATKVLQPVHSNPP